MRTIVVRVIRRTLIGFVLLAVGYVAVITAWMLVFDPMRGWGS